MKKLFAFALAALLALSFFAAAPSHPLEATTIPTDAPTEQPTATPVVASPTPELPPAPPDEGTEEEDEARADEQLPTTPQPKNFVHSIVIADSSGIAVDSTDPTNFMTVRAVVGRVALAKKPVDDSGSSGSSNSIQDADEELRCNPGGYCWFVKKTGILRVFGREKADKFRLKNIAFSEGTVTADIVALEKVVCITAPCPPLEKTVGSLSLSFVKRVEHAVWAGKMKLYDKEWNTYFPARPHSKLVVPKPLPQEKIRQCGLTRPLEEREVKACLQAGGKPRVEKDDRGCPVIKCVKPEEERKCEIEKPWDYKTFYLYCQKQGGGKPVVQWVEEYPGVKCPQVKCVQLSPEPPPERADFKSCKTADECTITEAGCCPCSSGGTYIAVRKDKLEEYRKNLACETKNIVCTQSYNCLENPVAVCINNQCNIGSTIAVGCNGVCEPAIDLTRQADSCPRDCATKCGNEVCEPFESARSTDAFKSYCPQDCKPTPRTCGNGVCEQGEVSYPTGAPNLTYCPADCKPAGYDKLKCEAVTLEFEQEIIRLNECESDSDCGYSLVKPNFFNCGFPINKNSDLTRLKEIAEKTKIACIMTLGGCIGKLPLWCKKLETGKKICADTPRPA